MLRIPVYEHFARDGRTYALLSDKIILINFMCVIGAATSLAFFFHKLDDVGQIITTLILLLMVLSLVGIIWSTQKARDYLYSDGLMGGIIWPSKIINEEF